MENMQMDSQESTGNSTDKLSADEAADNGGAIIGHLQDIYKLVHWDDDETGYIRTVLYKNGRIEVATHIDDAAGLAPTVFEMEHIEEAQAKQDKE